MRLNERSSPSIYPGENIFKRQDFEQGILHGFSCEWERAVWVLEPAHREKMRPPLFSLRDLKDRWGIWQGQKREIALSRQLVWEYSWASVREVLLHEMAHQLADEVLNARQEPPHGPLFHKACFLLRANPRASGNYRPLDARISQDHSEEDRLLLRVKKLMALAESPNRHEAEAAMAKAQALVAKYNLELLEREGKRDFISAFVGRPALRHFSEDYVLAHLLQDFYFVPGIWVPSYVPEKRKMGRVLEISGTLPNIKLALYVHDFVRTFIRSQWKEYNRERSLNRHRLTDFAVGIIEGFRSKLERPEETDPVSGCQALLKSDDPLLKEYLRYRYPHTGTIKTGRGSYDPGVRKDGKRVGKNLVISRGVTEGARARGLRLLS